jgi:hypothetical protein
MHSNDVPERWLGRALEQKRKDGSLHLIKVQFTNATVTTLNSQQTTARQFNQLKGIAQMEFTKDESAILEEAVIEGNIRDLSELQLALVGGGNADVSFH